MEETNLTNEVAARAGKLTHSYVMWLQSDSKAELDRLRREYSPRRLVCQLCETEQEFELLPDYNVRCNCTGHEGYLFYCGNR